MNQCPHCNKPIKMDSNWCPHCGNRLPIQAELSIGERIDNVRSGIFTALRIIAILSLFPAIFCISQALLIWWGLKSGSEPLATEFGPISVWLRSLIQSSTTDIEYLYNQYGNLIQVAESIVSLSAVAFGLIIFWFLGLFESIFGMTRRKNSFSSSLSQTSELLNAKVMEATVYGEEEWINEDESFPFNCISLTIKINNKNGSSRYIKYIRLEPEFIGKHGLMSINVSHGESRLRGFSYTANQTNLLWAVTILPLRNFFARMMRKQNGEAYMSTKTYTAAPIVDMEEIRNSRNVLTTWLFDRYTNEPFTLSKWIDMSTLSDIFFLNIIVKFSDELVNFQRKHHYAGNKVTIEIISEDGSTALTKPVDFKISQQNDEEYARIQQLISQNNASI